MAEKPKTWFGRPKGLKNPKPTRIIPKFSMPGPMQNFHGQLRKQYWKEGEIYISERLHRMGYNRKQICDVMGYKNQKTHALLRKPCELKIQDVLSLSMMLGEDFLDVLYEVSVECKKKGFPGAKKVRAARLEKTMDKYPHTNSSEYKGKSLKD